MICLAISNLALVLSTFYYKQCCRESILLKISQPLLSPQGKFPGARDDVQRSKVIAEDHGAVGHTQLGQHSGSMSPWGLSSVFCGSSLGSGSIILRQHWEKKNRREYITCRILLSSFLNVCICVLGCGVKCCFTLGGGLQSTGSQRVPHD